MDPSALGWDSGRCSLLIHVPQQQQQRALGHSEWVCIQNCLSSKKHGITRFSLAEVGACNRKREQICSVFYRASTMLHSNAFSDQRSLNPLHLFTRQKTWLPGHRHRHAERENGRGRQCPCLAEPMSSTTLPAQDGEEDKASKGSGIPHSGSYDVVILSNGPGEVASWVKPVVQALRQVFGEDRSVLRISVILSPCPHASGQEARLVRQFPEVDRCQEPSGFTRLLFLGHTVDGWDWRELGVCIFLGGDQFNALVLGCRLGYKTIIYAEDSARWPGLASMYALRTEELVEGIPAWARPRCIVVGDLFTDAVVGMPATPNNSSIHDEQPSPPARLLQTAPQGTASPMVGLLPGSKEAKLTLGVPYFMNVADVLHERLAGDVRFVLPLAPTVDVSALEAYCNRQSNPMIDRFGWSAGHIESVTVPADSGQAVKNTREGHISSHDDGEGHILLVTDKGVRIHVLSEFPPYNIFRRCTLCLTTVGTNTAELGELGVPMVVVLPTHALEVFRGSTGGILGLLTTLPGPLGAAAARALNAAALRAALFLSWPNRWAGEEVVPELVGRVEPDETAGVVQDLLASPGKLEKIQQRLLALRGNGRSLAPQIPSSSNAGCPGAAQQIAEQVQQMLNAYY